MGKKKLVVYDDQILIDMDLLFQAIREANGDWKSVEKEIKQFLEGLQDLGQEGE